MSNHYVIEVNHIVGILSPGQSQISLYNHRRIEDSEGVKVSNDEEIMQSKRKSHLKN